LNLQALEPRDVPATFAVSPMSNGAGMMGDAAATHSGSLSLDPSLPTDMYGRALVEADSAAQAIGKAFVGTITVQWAGETLSYAFGASTVASTSAAHKPFLITGTSIALEDMASSANGSDWDYNDHYWSASAMEVSPPPPPPPSPSTVSIAAGADAAEGGADGSFAFHRTGSLTSTLTVNYTVSGTATAGSDYTGTSMYGVTFAANSATASVVIHAVDDTQFEGAESVTLTLTSAMMGEYQLDSTAVSDTIAILDNDTTGGGGGGGPATVSIAGFGDTAEGGAPGAFRFTRTGSTAAELTVTYAASMMMGNGYATPGSDYASSGSGTVTFAAGASTVDLAIYAIEDTLVEGPETVGMSVTASMYGGAYQVDTTAPPATITIADNDTGGSSGAVTITSSGTLTEGDTAPGWFRIHRTDATSTLSVGYSMPYGSASQGSDYTGLNPGGGTAYFAVGQYDVTLYVQAIDDALVEGTETIGLSLLSPWMGSAQIDLNDNEPALVAGRMWSDLDSDGIEDDDEPGMLGLSVQLFKNEMPEGGPVLTGEDGEYSFEVIRDPAATYTVQFEKPDGYEFTISGAGSDRAKDSDANPSGRTADLFTYSAPAASLLGGVVLGTVGQEWSVRAAPTPEGSRPLDQFNQPQTHAMTFTVTRYTNLTQAVTIGYTTVAGTATAGQDYVAPAANSTLQFDIGQTVKTVTVEIKEDADKENDEEFFLVLKTTDFQVMPDGTTEPGRRTPFGRGIIRNDDFPNGYVDAWAGWGVDVRTSLDPKSNYENGTWMRGWDGNTPTYFTPTGTPWVHSMIDEGPYLKTNATYGAFRFTVDWRIADVGQAARPMFPTGMYRGEQNAEHFGNSGVYIYDRYEVQINSTVVPFGQAVPSQAPSDKTQLTPGWAYKVPPPTPEDAPVNFSQPPGTWNRMEIEFHPATIVQGVITQAAKLKVYFVTTNQNGMEMRWATFGGVNGWDLVDAGKALRATGGKNNDPRKYPPLDVGNLFLQSHWGSLVEFKNPVILGL